MSVALSFYRLASTALFPLMRNRLRRGHEVGFAERCGKYGEMKLAAFHERPTVWIHAVSVGEVQAASPVVSTIARSGWNGAILLSTVTETGAKSAATLVGDSVAAHIYAPWDVPGIVRKAANAVKPSLYAAVETEVWPNLLSELRRRQVPTFLLNARISDRTWAKKRYLKGLLKEAYGLFDCILARSDGDAHRLLALGVAESRVHTAGDCKIDAIIERRKAVLPLLPSLRGKLSIHEHSPCFVAGSTHPGEEEIVLEAFAGLRNSSDALREARLILAPRHPERAGDVRAMAEKTGRTELFSSLMEESGNTGASIIIVDVIGVLFQLYALASSVFIGGSLVPKGGQNILEPAIWGTPVLHGPYMEDFAGPTSELDALGAAWPVCNAAEIETLWRKAWTGDLPGASGSDAYFSTRSGASEKSWQYMKKYL